MTEHGIVQAVVWGLYRGIFPDTLRKKVRDKFQTESWIEFCNRLAGVGVLMAVLGGITLLLLEADIGIKIGPINDYQVAFQVVNPLSGTIVLLVVWAALHVIGWTTDGGPGVPWNPEGRISDIVFNTGRVLVGLGLVVGMFLLFLESSFGDRTLVEEIIRYVSTMGLLSLILAPVFYGFGLFGRGILELLAELR